MSRKIGALWVRETQEGKKFMSGLIETLNGDVQIAVFKNDKKEKENQPDYNIVLSERAKQQAQADQSPAPEDIPF
ncbi:MAG: DUF736 family protein [Parcubacteria group bacterium]|nr:DUF736 family protein [Parcubacteria group bacterium]